MEAPEKIALLEKSSAYLFSKLQCVNEELEMMRDEKNNWILEYEKILDFQTVFPHSIIKTVQADQSKIIKDHFEVLDKSGINNISRIPYINQDQFDNSRIEEETLKKQMETKGVDNRRLERKILELNSLNEDKKKT